MQPFLRASLASRVLPRTRTFLTTIPRAKEGRGPEEHVTNQDHSHNIHAEASNKGQQAKAEDASDDGLNKNSTATSQGSTDTAKEAESKHGRKDRGMGLQDERGGVSVALAH